MTMLVSTHTGQLYENMTSSVKPEVHNVSQCRQRRTEPRQRRNGQYAKQFGKVRLRGFRVMRWTDRQTDKQTC